MSMIGTMSQKSERESSQMRDAQFLQVQISYQQDWSIVVIIWEIRNWQSITKQEGHLFFMSEATDSEENVRDNCKLLGDTNIHIQLKSSRVIKLDSKLARVLRYSKIIIERTLMIDINCKSVWVHKQM